MNVPPQPTPSPRASGPARGPGGIAGTVFFGVLLTVANLATAYCVVVALMVAPDGPWDDEAVFHSLLASCIGAAFAVGTALLTLPAVAA